MQYGTPLSLPYLILLCICAMLAWQATRQTGFYRGWPPDSHSEPVRIMTDAVAVRPGDKFRGRALVLVGMSTQQPVAWGTDFFPVLYFKHRQGLGNDLMNDAEALGVPLINEYGHWVSPPMLALMAAAFYRPEDSIDRAAQAPRVFRQNLARLLGVSLVVSDQPVPSAIGVYSTVVLNQPVHISRVDGANVGQYSPTQIVIAENAHAILDMLQKPNFDGTRTAVLEAALQHDLVAAEAVSVFLEKGPHVRVEVRSRGTSLLILPFDFSHCLRVEGSGLLAVVPANLSQTGLVIRGNTSVRISYRYGLLHGTSCRRDDLERIKRLDLEEAATGRVFRDARPKQSARP